MDDCKAWSVGVTSQFFGYHFEATLREGNVDCERWVHHEGRTEHGCSSKATRPFRTVVGVPYR